MLTSLYFESSVLMVTVRLLFHDYCFMNYQFPLHFRPVHCSIVLSRQRKYRFGFARKIFRPKIRGKKNKMAFGH